MTYSKIKDGQKKLSPNFKVAEFACKDGSDKILIDDRLIFVLQAIRTHFDKPITINSGYRSPEYNKKIGGATSSQHMLGTAADIVVQGVTLADVSAYAEKMLLNGGIGTYTTFNHVDVREIKSRWNG